jgi:hypothetical protein
MGRKTLHDIEIDAIKKGINYEGFAREDLLRYAEEKGLNAGDVLVFILDALKEHCPYNFFGCSDYTGERLAFSKDNISEALDIPNPTCAEVCGNGCCAFINQILASIGRAIHKDDDEA